MIRRPRDRRSSPIGPRALLALLAVLLLVNGCSDAPTEKEIALADDGIDPSIVSIFTSEELLPTVQELGTVYLIDHPTTTFQYTALDTDTIARRLDDGVRPALWIDDADTLAPFVDEGLDAPAPVGEDVMQFVVYRAYDGPVPTLDVFGAGPSEARSALCDLTAECGRSAQAILDQAGVTPAPDLLLPTAREIVAAAAKGNVDTTIVYRSELTGLYTAFRNVPLPDPSIGKRTYVSLRLNDDLIGLSFQSWIATSKDASQILAKKGLRPRPVPGSS